MPERPAGPGERQKGTGARRQDAGLRSPVARAAMVLNDTVNRCRREGRQRLPGVRAIAREAGVSPKSAWKAVRALREKGAVAVIPGGGVFLAPSSPGTALDPAVFEPTPSRNPPRVSRAEQVRRTIARDILTGRLPPGSMLPTYKELTQQYGTSYVTMRTALQQLVEEHRLEPSKRGFRVFQVSARSGRPAVVFVGRLGGTSSLVRATPMAPTLWATIEQERMRLDIDVDLVEFDTAFGFGPASHAGASVQEMVRRKPVLGFLMSTLGLRGNDLERGCERLAALGSPVSVLVEGVEPQVPQVVAGNPLFRFLTHAGGSLSGEIVADYLLALGHRRIAVFTPFSESVWSRIRIEGMQRVVARAGRECSLEVFDATLPQLWDRIMENPVFDDYFRSVERFAQATNRPGDSTEDLFTGNVTRHYIMSQFLKSHMTPYFRRALADPGITAWVGANDLVGLVALGFLRGEGVPVPGRVSVVSFDDIIEAFGVGLSSYNFNVPSIVRAMLEHVMAPPRLHRTVIDDYEIPGMVMARQSTGPPPRR